MYPLPSLEEVELLFKMDEEKDPLVNERSGAVREIGKNAIWSLSSCKPGKQKIHFITKHLNSKMPHLKILFHWIAQKKNKNNIIIKY